MSYENVLDSYQWDSVRASIYAKTSADVERALASDRRNLDDFQALISPAAEPYLERMAQLSQQATLKRFGRTIQMYVPLYLSNLCENKCVYCGFSSNNKIRRKVLNTEEIIAEAKAIKELGFEHILLVTGEASKKVGVEYLKEAFELLKPHFALISIEVQPLDTDEYAYLCQHGLHSVYIYQETYNRAAYPDYHLGGKKADFAYRLATPERLGEAGVHKIGLGILTGLEDWRTDTFFCAAHLRYLEKHYWRTKYSISFPRLRPHEGQFQPNHIMTDAQLLQLICAYRLLDEELELSLSTRESAVYRDNVMKLGITSMSAGSKTEPGGYAQDNHELEQFAVSDDRSPLEVKEAIERQGYHPVWKDWDHSLGA